MSEDVYRILVGTKQIL